MSHNGENFISETFSIPVWRLEIYEEKSHQREVTRKRVIGR